jgi:hypothetical protein
LSASLRCASPTTALHERRPGSPFTPVSFP